MRYDYAEMWLNGKLLAQNYMGASTNVFPDYVPKPPGWKP